MGRKDFIIIGFIFGCIGIVISSCFGNIGIELAAGNVLGAFEEQMFEEMRKARALRRFIFRTDMIGDIQANDRSFMILMQNNMKPVGKIVFGISNGAGLMIHPYF